MPTYIMSKVSGGLPSFPCGPCCPCRLAAIVNDTLAGVTFCAGPVIVGTNGFGQVVSIQITSWNDPNVLTPVTWDNVVNCESGNASANLGRLDFDVFLDGIFDHSDFFTNGLGLGLSCTNAGLTTIVTLNLRDGPDNYFGIAFLSTNIPLDTVAPNELVACGDTYGGFYTVFGITGTSIVELP